MSTPMTGPVELCGLTGNTVRPWARAGWHCTCYDLQHSIRKDRVELVGRGSITYRWGDVRSMTRKDLGNPVALFAGPPCTGLTVSGVRDWPRKGLQGLIDALVLVESCRKLIENADLDGWIENPIGSLSTNWRKPDYYFHPWEYAGYLPADFTDPNKPDWTGPEVENYTKKTCLFTFGDFVMPEPKPFPAPHRADIWTAPPSEDRADLRSATPCGFAEGNWLANDPIGAAGLLGVVA